MYSQQNAPRLIEENQQFSGSGGVSEGNAQCHFSPAFLDADSGQVELSRFRNGQQAPCHLLDGLPEAWITRRDLKGRVVETKSSVVSGFVRLGRFFTRQEAAEFIEHMTSDAI